MVNVSQPVALSYIIQFGRQSFRNKLGHLLNNFTCLELLTSIAYYSAARKPITRIWPSSYHKRRSITVSSSICSQIFSSSSSHLASHFLQFFLSKLLITNYSVPLPSWSCSGSNCWIIRMLSSHIRKDKIVGSIKYLEYQVQRLINLNCVTKFR